MQRLHISLRPSLQLAVILVLAHALGVWAVLAISIPFWAQFALVICVIFSLAYYLARDALLYLPSSCVAFGVDGGLCVLTSKNGRQTTGQISLNSVVHPSLIVLIVIAPATGMTRNLIIFPDTANQEMLRKLRVQLRWQLSIEQKEK